MPKIIVKAGQSLLDVAVKYYGSVEGVFDIVRRNGLNGVTDNIYAGELLEVADSPLNARVVRFLSSHQVATMEDRLRPEGIGWMTMDKNFCVRSSLISVSTMEQLNAIRYDLDGDGVPEGTPEEKETYYTSFPELRNRSSAAKLSGYKLTTDLDFRGTKWENPTNGTFTGTHEAGGWNPIADYSALLDGRGFTIRHLYQTQDTGQNLGFFECLTDGALDLVTLALQEQILYQIIRGAQQLFSIPCRYRS